MLLTRILWARKGSDGEKGKAFRSTKLGADESKSCQASVDVPRHPGRATTCSSSGVNGEDQSGRSSNPSMTTRHKDWPTEVAVGSCAERSGHHDPTGSIMSRPHGADEVAVLRGDEDQDATEAQQNPKPQHRDNTLEDVNKSMQAMLASGIQT